MAQDGDLIDFNIIEEQKENISALPSGRSAKALAQLYSPVNTTVSTSETQDIHAAARREFEQDLILIDESDDPLDIYDRYVRWTLDAYPSATATPQSQLLPLLERATRAFLKSDQYKNDARYLKIWLTYIRLFPDSPREVYAFLARNGVGASLALYYEEFAAWLEGDGRYNQAEEIYCLGLERNAAPVARLTRKFEEFRRRAESRSIQLQEPSSPALPIVRPALAAKTDLASLMRIQPDTVDPQAPSRTSSAPGKCGKKKMQVFEDETEPSIAGNLDRAGGWENMATISERRKENTIAAQPWAGATLSTTIRSAVVPKMEIYRDETSRLPMKQSFPPQHIARDNKVVNPRTGRIETVFVNLELVYPNPDDDTEEYCFEELRAASRGWLNKDWASSRPQQSPKSKTIRPRMPTSESTTTLIPLAGGDGSDGERLARKFEHSLNVGDENNPSAHPQENEQLLAKRLRRQERANRTRKIKAETQTIQTNLDSPKGPRIKRKKSTEPTMTVNTRAAMDEVYELFNQAINETEVTSDDEESDNESDDEDDYTSAGESTTTGRISGATSEYGEETRRDLDSKNDAGTTAEVDTSQEDTAWTEPTASKHMSRNDEEDDTDGETGQDFSAQDTVGDQPEDDDLVTPTSPHESAPSAGFRFMPSQPESYRAPNRPYRDAAQVAANRLPFMTPIVEKTESSMGTMTKHDKDYFNSKTPCPKADHKDIAQLEDETWGVSPFQDVLKEAKFQDVLKDTSRHNIQSPKPGAKKASPIIARAPKFVPKKEATAPRGPIIKDLQCNPMGEDVHQAILQEAQPPLSSHDGFFDNRHMVMDRRGEIQRFCKQMKNNKMAGDKTTSATAAAPILKFDDAERSHTIKKELGAGAYAPVFLTEQYIGDDADDAPAVVGRGGVIRSRFEAIKMEDPPSAWEFYMLRTTHRRLGVSRPVVSIIQAYEMHLFKDEGYLVEEYRDQGTLLNLVNIVSEQSRANGVHGGMDEHLAMFFSIEILRTVEALHAKGIIHGDLKADNVLVRFTDGGEGQFSCNYRRDGNEGWSSKGITLIDFGRSIDMRAFVPNVQFIADWPTSETDCAEMRELRPWTYQADYHGIAAIAHTMLFGKYIETVAEKGSGAGIVSGAAKNYRLREGLKRYWQTEIWGEFFTLLLNPGRHLENEEGQRMPVSRGMRNVREKMEAWLEGNSEKGVGLKNWIKRLETSVGSKRKA